MRQRQGKKEISHLSVHSPDGNNVEGCARLKPGTRTSVQISHVIDRCWSTCDMFHCLPRHLSRGLNRTAGNQTVLSLGVLVLKAVTQVPAPPFQPCFLVFKILSFDSRFFLSIFILNSFCCCISRFTYFFPFCINFADKFFQWIFIFNNYIFQSDFHLVLFF